MKQITQYACNYAVLRFLPYPETGEFVNLGVVVHCPAQGFLAAELERRKTQRVTNFFPELERTAFTDARRAIADEFWRLEKLVAAEKDTELGRRIFQEFVRPRETVFRFGEIRTILTEDPTTVVESLFKQYVNRDFAQPKVYQETVMAQRFYAALRKLRPDKIFHRGRLVGTAEYHVRIPITTSLLDTNDTPLRAIKPLDLQRPDPTAVIEHGDAWIQRVRRLKAIQRMPDRFIFAVRQPNGGNCMDAAEKIVADLKAEGAMILGADETENLVALAAD